MAKRHSEPKQCPHCGSLKYRSTKKGGITRCCGETIVTVNGGWYATKEDAPEWQIIDRFVQKKKRKLPMYAIPYGSPSYREFVKAAANLLDKCDGDIELALGVIDVAFDSPPHSIRNKPTLFHVASKWYLPDMKAMALAIRGRAEREREAESLYSAGSLSMAI